MIAIFLIFAPATSVEVLLTTSFKGTELVFGAENYFAFSFMNMLTYLLAIAGLVFVLMKLVGAKSKLFDFLGSCLLIAAGAFFFLTTVFAVPVEGYATVYNNATVHLLVGPILAGIFSLLSGAGMLCYALFRKKIIE